MNKTMAPKVVFALGLAALVLRRQLYLTAVDEKGLLVRMHPLSIALLALTAAVCLLVVCTARKTRDEAGTSSISALGHIAMALGILATVLPSVPMAGYLGIAWRWLGLASPLCLLAAAAASVLKKQPFFLLHVVPCLFFVVHIVSRYQLWSSNPQMQDYLFALLSTMALAFFSFYKAAEEVDCGNRPMLLTAGLAAVYLCLAELANSGSPALYFSGMIWCLMELPPRAKASRTEE